MTIRITKSIELDSLWVHTILLAAFDYSHGACNHWLLREGEVERLGEFRGIDPWVSSEGWWAVELKGSICNIIVGATMLEGACSQLLNDAVWSEAKQQLIDAIEFPNHPPALGTHIIDTIIQLALYGELRYTNQ